MGCHRQGVTNQKVDVPETDRGDTHTHTHRPRVTQDVNARVDKCARCGLVPFKSLNKQGRKEGRGRNYLLISF